jgi:ubiquinone/menaquinone biosynthesis C-methylase UbiE
MTGTQMTQLDERVEARGDAVGFFDESAEHYEQKYYSRGLRSFMTVRQARVLEFVKQAGLRPGANVLDAGCGPGSLVEQLAIGGYRVSAMDAAEGMLRQARARVEAAAPLHPVQFSLGDIEQLPYPDASFDLVCSTGVIEYLKDDAQVLTEFRRVLRPGGFLVLPVTNIWSPANWLDVVVEPLKRQYWFRVPFNSIWQRMGHPPILPRHFPVRMHRPRAFCAELRRADFQVRDQLFFHFLPWPRPLDRVAPSVTHRLGEAMERQARGVLGLWGEGFLVLAQRA